MKDYEKEAEEFAVKHGITLTVVGQPDYKKYFNGDTESRWVFKLRLKRKDESYTFTFGQSIAEGKKTPTLYSVLTCLQKYDVGSFEDFCGEFGYEHYTAKERREHMTIYNNVVKEYEAVERLFGDIIEELDEIQ